MGILVFNTVHHSRTGFVVIFMGLIDVLNVMEVKFLVFLFKNFIDRFGLLLIVYDVVAYWFPILIPDQSDGICKLSF